MRGWRIFPTPMGIGFALMVFILLLTAMNFSNNLLFTFCFFMAAVFLLSAWFTLRNLGYIKLTNIKARSVHVGQLLDFQLAVKDDAGIEHLYLQINKDNSSFHLSPNGEGLWHYTVATKQRGLQPEAELRLSSTWPLGLFRVSKKLGSLPSVLVYPSADVTMALAEHSSNDVSHNKFEAEELLGLRDYQAGDNLRRIDWRAMARRQQLLVKEFDGAAGDSSLWLDWQATEGMPYEQRISCLCHWVLACQKAERDFGLRLPKTKILPDRSAIHVQACLTALAQLPMVEGESL